MDEKSLKRRIFESSIWKTIKHDSRFKLWRKVIIFTLGVTLLISGIAMIVLPGPAFVVIPLSLAILGTEFMWARRWYLKIKAQAYKIKGKMSQMTHQDD